ncbi:SDR family NAD(P)-dependent oxidoreductase, partial [Salipiger abyssi]
MPTIPISAPARLDGKIALVTGAAGGIGRATALALAEAGATVVATDIADHAEFESDKIIYRRYDVTSRDETRSIIAETKAEHGAIDALILCAGTISHKHLVDSTDEEWRSILDVNLMGVVNP